MVKNILTALTSLTISATTIANITLQQVTPSITEKTSQNGTDGYHVNSVKITIKDESGKVVDRITFYNSLVSLGDMLASDSDFFGLNETAFGRLLIRVDYRTTDFNKNYWAIYSSTHPFCKFSTNPTNYCSVGIDGLVFRDVWEQDQLFDFILTNI
ncbi:hypothetical protein [Spiroplasma sp. SV19]|uniref:hypothetical protein n=1 Tax=Spiroplasma sp. SV19 TaxID=2570468 RepID=UPI0024B78A04|nr:hypothetical protein [Spiroplasma sp. SV19]WHQ37113.1 hypothetical protein E7Y35_04375 [Spiroplasma sp. SV19]